MRVFNPNQYFDLYQDKKRLMYENMISVFVQLIYVK